MPSRYKHVEDNDDCEMIIDNSLDTNSDNDKATVNFPRSGRGRCLQDTYM